MCRKVCVTKSFVAITVMVIGVAASSSSAEYKTTFDYMLTVHRDWVTPHIPWAKPYAHGKPHVLYICGPVGAPREIVELSERLDIDFDVVIGASGHELAVRDAASDPYTAFVTPMRPLGRRTAVAENLEKPWDVIVFGQTLLTAIEEPQRRIILEKIKQGAGMVLVYFDGLPTEIMAQLKPVKGADALLEGIPIRQNPGFIACRTFLPQDKKDKPIVRLYQLGKGRVAIIDYGYFYSPPSGLAHVNHGLTPWVANWPFYAQASYKYSTGGAILKSLHEYPEMSRRFPIYDWTVQVHYEYALMLPARVILWATGRMEPQVRFANLPEVAVIDKANKDSGISIEIIAGVLTTADIRYVFRHESGDELAAGILEDQTIGPARKKLTVPVPATLPACRAFCELQIVSAKGVEAWGAVPMEIRNPATVAIKSFDQTKYEIGQMATVTLNFSKEALGKMVAISGYDYFRREIIRTIPVAVEDTTQTVGFTVPAIDNLALVLHARLLDKDGTLLARTSDRTLTINQDKFRRANFPVVVFDTETGGYLEALLSERMRRIGINAEVVYPGSQNIEDAVFWDMMPLPFLGSTGKFQYGTGDEALIKRQLDYYPARAKYLDKYPILAYNFGDELHMGSGGFDLGTDEHWHKRFLVFLRDKYKTIDALNNAWASQYKTFDEIPPLKVEEARKTEAYSVILERWAFLQQQWAQFFIDAKAKIRQSVPDAPVGWEGSGSDAPSLWANFRVLGPEVEMWGPYQHNECDLAAGILFRSFVPRRVLTGYWWGGYASMREPKTLSYLLWNHAVRGANMMFLYHAVGPEGIFGADCTPSHHLLLQLENLRKMITEIGPLVGKSYWVPDPVAIYWSVSSQVGRVLHGGRDIRWDALHGLVHALCHAGYDPSFVDSQSDLAPEKYKAIILYDAQCLSDDEVKKLAEYVRQGGVLITDVPPASCTELGVARKTPPLDDLFGIKRDPEKCPPGFVKVRRANARMRTTYNGRPIRLSLLSNEGPCDVHVVEGVVVGDEAQVLGESINEIPVFITKKTGRGQTILMNMTFDTYFGMHNAVPYTPLGTECEVRRKVAFPGAMARFVEDMLRSVDVAPQVQVLREDRPLQNIRHSLHRNGQDLVLSIACLPIQAKGEAIALLLRRYHVVDMRSGKYLGYTKRIPVIVGPGEGAVFSLLERRPELPIVTPVKQTVKRGQPLSLTISLPETGREINVLKIVTIGPREKKVDWLCKTWSTNDKRITFTAPMAWNDPLGRYQVTVADVSTARSVTVTFDLVENCKTPKGNK